ncbi:hypothetical protein SISNIDRAFT_486247 [Sistotremastrum niveocremeum HHB9708]|uniref:Uncharacterized protein n=1 Tax=Sistotremastrum niveocremeum HHB9708 TaxID=1314777 RepID=A0A164TY43_9AGAM|nr:hypothetical protein SISNIDRAFT_486247 [Sistotremastrum niveocremeum HHB9708]
MRPRTAPIFILLILWGVVVTKPLPQDSSISRECDEQRIACSDNGFSTEECQEQLSDCQGDESNLDLSFEVEFKPRGLELLGTNARRNDDGRASGLVLVPGLDLTPNSNSTLNINATVNANDTAPVNPNTTLSTNTTSDTNTTTDAYYPTADPYTGPDPDVSIVDAYYQTQYTTVDPYTTTGVYTPLSTSTSPNIDPTTTSDPTVETDPPVLSAYPSESTAPPPPSPPPVSATGDQDGEVHGKETSEYRTHHDISYLIPGTFGNESD